MVSEEEHKLNKELDDYKSKIKDEVLRLEKELEDLKKRKEEIIASKEYKQLLNLKTEREEINLKIKKLKDSLGADFSILDRPLKKYKHEKDVEQYKDIIEHYRTNTIHALITDTKLEIIKILEEVSKGVLNGELCSKDKKTEKIVEQIKRMNQQFFMDFVKEYNLMMENKKGILNKIKGNDIEEKIDYIDYKQDSIKSEIEQKKQDLESKKQSFAKKLKQCPKCGEKIPREWQYHQKCGWKKDKEKEETHLVGKSQLEVFTSPLCPSCHPALDLAKEIEKERDDVKVTELSTATPHGRRKAKQRGVSVVPTIFVKGPAYPQNIGLKGLPSKKGLLKAIDISLGLAKWEEPKGFFKSLLEKLPVKIKW